MAGPGKKNLITDVSGVKVGNAHDERARSGVSVLLTPQRAVAGVEQRGGAPGTRETNLLDPSCLVDEVDAIVLSGGSVYGLEAASSIANELGARGQGYQLGEGSLVAPIVPAAILFDLRNGGEKAWGAKPPYHDLGRRALLDAGGDFQIGKAGAGFGALAGAYEGGLGSASFVTDDGFEVGALVAVNSFGSPFRPGGEDTTRSLWAAEFALGKEMGSKNLVPAGPISDFPSDTKVGALPGMNTTIGTVAVNAALTSAEAGRLAIMGEDGLARAIRPIHTPMDGDTVFSVATGLKTLPDEGRPLALARLGLLAADCLTRACGRAIYETNRALFD